MVLFCSALDQMTFVKHNGSAADLHDVSTWAMETWAVTLARRADGCNLAGRWAESRRWKAGCVEAGDKVSQRLFCILGFLCTLPPPHIDSVVIPQKRRALTHPSSTQRRR